MTIRVDDSARTMHVGVGDLVRIINNSRRQPQRGSRYSAQWGQKIHRRLMENASQDERSSELHVSHTIALEEYKAVISGRIDLLQREEDKTFVQEIKTVALTARDLENSSENDFPPFRDQLRIYLYLLDCAENHRNTKGQLLVVSILDGSYAEIPVTYEREQVFLLIRSVLLGILNERRQAKLKQEYRRSFAGRIQFPYESPRRYQEEIGTAVSNALEIKNHLLLSAPTGTGKTAAVMTALLRFAIGHDMRVFWASGKTSHQKIVADTLRLVLPSEAPVSALFLMAKEKLCPNGIFICEESVCPYSEEFSARLKQSAALDQLQHQQIILPEAIARAGKETKLCPFELSLKLAERADIIVGDYNYIFDPKISLRSLLLPKKRKEWILVIDEAHNLYPRARGYFSPSISVEEIERAQQSAASNDAASAAFSLLEEVKAHIKSLGPKNRRGEGGKSHLIELDRPFFSRVGSRLDEILSDYFLAKLRMGSETAEDPLAQCLTNLKNFCDAQTLEIDSASIYEPSKGTLKLVCLDPSAQLQEKIKSFYAAIAVSATLEPHRFFQDVLGFPADETVAEAFPSPFHRENRKTMIVPTISTVYRDRTQSAPEVARLIREVAGLKRGNYAAFFPSYAYLRLVQTHLHDFPGRLIVQQERMREEDLAQTLEYLKDPTATNLILAVQGGSLAEGVDYAGGSLDGAFIVGVGLPELSLENELLKNFFDEKYGAGFEYAYLYPGMIRVIQSAGRIIRSENDTGFIILIGRRYATPAYHSLLPREWYDYSVEELVSADPVTDIRDFWESF